MSPSILATLSGGFVLLIIGAEIFVRGASRLATLVGISPLVVGLTVVAFGTSSPEVAVSLQSTLAGAADLALGNVIGSNICNILLILGLSATVAPLVVADQLVRLDVPVMVVISFLLLGLTLDGALNRPDALLLLAGAAAYTTFLIVQSRREGIAAATPEELAGATDGSVSSWLLNLLLIGGGLALLVFGSRWLVGSAISVAQFLGVSELVIGLTVVAIGTSLPELATSVVAAFRGERDIAVGNVVGSNIFNILLVLGVAGVAGSSGVPVAPAALSFDLPVMIAVAVACLPIFFTGHRIERWEGLLFIGYYVAYTAYLILDSARHDALPIFSAVMGLFVLPLTVITLATLSLRAWREARRSPTL
ncbi:MAG: calcium/sodium antiporter [Gemmatimonas sp.]|nr:calcium/sodium antiporter [Gemmatimonas sp.]